MKISTRMKGWLALVIATFLLFSVISVYQKVAAREARPDYDGDNSNFELALVSNDAKAEVGDIYTIEVNVKNKELSDETMYVQCSILDREEQTWIGTDRAFTTLGQEDDNCFPGEPFSQTAVVGLSNNQNEDVEFTVRVPDTINGDYVIYCEAFERCSKDAAGNTQEKYASDSLVKSIEVIADDGTSSNDNLVDTGDLCTVKTDCPGNYISDIVCLNGHCMENGDQGEEPSDWKLDWPDMPDITDEKIKDYVTDHKYLVSIVIISLFIIGTIMVFSDN